MAWVTYQASLNKSGGPFQSNGAGRPSYDFPEALGSPLLKTIVDEWHDFFQVELPKTEAPLFLTTTSNWKQYLDELHHHIHATAPDIIHYLTNPFPTLHSIAQELNTSLTASLATISSAAAQIHPFFMYSLRCNITAHFNSALRITGKGHFSAEADTLFGAGYARMQDAYAKRAAALPAQLRDLVKTAVKGVKMHIGLLLNNLQAVHVEGGSAGQDSLERKVRLQEAAKAVVCWVTPQCTFGLKAGSSDYRPGPAGPYLY
ncbi:hypothetical protein N0V88_000833 [Collariella sp. IMI 366227]|nr:hypothetical protein N0V88_000833 [Collariella sp. IMI 366227]